MQRFDHPWADCENPDPAGGEDRELPRFAECRGQRDRGAEDRSDRGLSDSIEERARVLALADPSSLRVRVLRNDWCQSPGDAGPSRLLRVRR